MLSEFHNLPSRMSLRPHQRLCGQATLSIQVPEAPIQNSFQFVAALLLPPMDLAVPHQRKKTIQKLQTISSFKYAINPCHSRPSLFPPLRLRRNLQICPCPLALPSFFSPLHCLSIRLNHIGRLHLFSFVMDP